MTITTRIHTFFYGKLVGVDQYGNSYFTEKKASKRRKAKRWVLYNGKAEPSKVPPEWHGWLHYTTDTPLVGRGFVRQSWQRPHVPNLTGTRSAYVPPGHLLRGGMRAATTADYKAWIPEEKIRQLESTLQ